MELDRDWLPKPIWRRDIYHFTNCFTVQSEEILRKRRSLSQRHLSPPCLPENCLRTNLLPKQIYTLLLNSNGELNIDSHGPGVESLKLSKIGELD